MECELHFFFATLHEKSACDGIGGVVKRVTAKLAYRDPLKIKY